MRGIVHMIPAETFHLKTKNGGWLGQVTITADGMFAAVTDYGNFSYTWRSFGDNFKDFLISLSAEYFGEKMACSNAYVDYNTKIEKAAYVFTDMFLPEMQLYLINQKNKGWR